MPSWKSCNVLRIGRTAHQLWHFDVRRGRPVLDSRVETGPEAPLPTQLVGKNWRGLLQPRLNVAWLPPESVYLRVLRLPSGPAQELFSMVELQLEKLAPLPVSQIVWAVHALEPGPDGLVPVIVMIAERDAVEAVLGSLEEMGYMADRLELPVIDLLLAVRPDTDAVCVFPAAAESPETVFLAWWADGTLRHLNMLRVPADPTRAEVFRHQFMQTLMAGEFEGWFRAPRKIVLVASNEQAEQWRSIMPEIPGCPVEVVPPPKAEDLAAASAYRAVQSAESAGLLPGEYAVRYRQQFIDSLWMRGLGVVLGAYTALVLLYMAAVQLTAMKVAAVERQVAELGPAYTNVLSLEARYNVLKERQELKFAALDCWRTIVELLPEGLVLQALDFSDGHRLRVDGTAPADLVGRILDFNEAVRKVQQNGRPMFTSFSEFNSRTDPNNVTASWNFSCELNRATD